MVDWAVRQRPKEMKESQVVSVNERGGIHAYRDM